MTVSGLIFNAARTSIGVLQSENSRLLSILCPVIKETAIFIKNRNEICGFMGVGKNRKLAQRGRFPREPQGEKPLLAPFRSPISVLPLQFSKILIPPLLKM
jgi:hypothetical protein